MTDGESEMVVLLHGLTGHSMLMRPIHRHLSRLGFKVRDWPFWTLRKPIDQHADRLQADIGHWLSAGNVGRLHLVGHSLGSIVIRSVLGRGLLDSQQVAKVGRFVQIAPPNGGSPKAAFLYRWGLKLQPFQELSDTSQSYVTNLADPSEDFSVGILAASRDRVVPLQNTKLASYADYQVIKAGHTTILFRRQTRLLVGNFLQHGRFTAG